MENNRLPEGFSRFSWLLVGFCFPILLWPLALLLSPAVVDNPNLANFHRTFISFTLWFYPLALAIMARILFKLNQRRPKLAEKALYVSAVVFWGVFAYVVAVGFN
ncbi:MULTISPECIES: DUF5389 family protein [unclassified Lonepinella]|uniref:DUF5389 family protein n=1 Tax=unclassified Lonepinella TaxID=2642006 RepID=UPI003F6DB8BE